MPLGKIPIFPRKRKGWERFGLTLKTGGRFETWVAFPLRAAGIPGFGAGDVYRLAGEVPAVLTVGAGVGVWAWAQTRLVAHKAARALHGHPEPRNETPLAVSRRPW